MTCKSYQGGVSFWVSWIVISGNVHAFFVIRFHDLICALSTSDHVPCGRTRHCQALHLLLGLHTGLYVHFEPLLQLVSVPGDGAKGSAL